VWKKKGVTPFLAKKVCLQGNVRQGESRGGGKEIAADGKGTRLPSVRSNLLTICKAGKCGRGAGRKGKGGTMQGAQVAEFEGA